MNFLSSFAATSSAHLASFAHFLALYASIVAYFTAVFKTSNPDIAGEQERLIASEKSQRNHQDSPLWQIVNVKFYHDWLFTLYDWFMRRQVELFNISSNFSLAHFLIAFIKLIRTAGFRRQLFSWTLMLVLYVFISDVCRAIRLSIPIGFRRVIFNCVIRRVFGWHFQHNLPVDLRRRDSIN